MTDERLLPLAARYFCARLAQAWEISAKVYALDPYYRGLAAVR
jgi:hypothetical protein